MVGGDPADMSRAALDSPTVADVVAHLLANPGDMQRPVAVIDGRAVIGRPSERVFEILD